jgi:hypothetical protein
MTKKDSSLVENNYVPMIGCFVAGFVVSRLMNHQDVVTGDVAEGNFTWKDVTNELSYHKGDKFTTLQEIVYWCIIAIAVVTYLWGDDVTWFFIIIGLIVAFVARSISQFAHGGWWSVIAVAFLVVGWVFWSDWKDGKCERKKKKLEKEGRGWTIECSNA